MKTAVVIFAILSTGGLSVALAEPPVTPVPDSGGPPAQSSPAEDGARQSSASQTAPAISPVTTATSATSAKTPAQRAADEEAEQRMLRLQGYKAQMMGGEVVYCRREIPLGSHLPTTLKCITPAEAKLIALEGRQTTERFQRGTAGCLMTSTLRGPGTGPANCGASP